MYAQIVFTCSCVTLQVAVVTNTHTHGHTISSALLAKMKKKTRVIFECSNVPYVFVWVRVCECLQAVFRKLLFRLIYECVGFVGLAFTRQVWYGFFFFFFVFVGRWLCMLCVCVHCAILSSMEYEPNDNNKNSKYTIREKRQQTAKTTTRQMRHVCECTVRTLRTCRANTCSSERKWTVGSLYFCCCPLPRWAECVVIAALLLLLLWIKEKIFRDTSGQQTARLYDEIVFSISSKVAVCAFFVWPNIARPMFACHRASVSACVCERGLMKNIYTPYIGVYFILYL